MICISFVYMCKAQAILEIIEKISVDKDVILKDVPTFAEVSHPERFHPQ